MAITSRIATFNRLAVRRPGLRPFIALGIATIGLVAAASALSTPAAAFSQITRQDGTVLQRDDVISAPLPPLDPNRSGTPPDWGSEPADGSSLNDLDARERQDTAPLTVHYEDDGLPSPVRDLRARLLDIARAGEIEALRPYLETGANATALSVAPTDEDPIEFLKNASGDGEGVEILAILLDVLRAGHVRLDEGQDSEIFIWPYFAQTSIDELTRPQLVELFQIVTAGDYQQMRELGAYYFYRIGISPDGRLEFFLAGD